MKLPEKSTAAARLKKFQDQMAYILGHGKTKARCMPARPVPQNAAAVGNATPLFSAPHLPICSRFSQGPCEWEIDKVSHRLVRKTEEPANEGKDTESEGAPDEQMGPEEREAEEEGLGAAWAYSSSLLALLQHMPSLPSLLAERRRCAAAANGERHAHRTFCSRHDCGRRFL